MMNASVLTLRSITDDEMTPENALKIGQLVGRSYKTVCIGSDTNPSSRMIKSSLISGLLSVGADVNDADIAPAPALALASGASDCMMMVGEPDEQGVISKIYIMNSDGSIFTKEQLRHMIKKGEMEHNFPGYNGVGTIRLYDSVIEDYNRTISNRYGKDIDAPVILDCGCGCTSICAPQILSSIGADLTTINAQNDPKYSPRPPGVGVNDVSKLVEIVDLELGSIGIALNGDGTKLALIDEEGNYVDPENILALLLMYLRPSSLVIPFDASAIINDAFHNTICEGCKGSRTDDEAGNEKIIIRADNDLESITAAVKEHGAQMGAMDDGTFIFPEISMCPDAINATVILTKMSGENSISNLLASFPKYIIIRESINDPGKTEQFNKELANRLKELDTEGVLKIDGNRVEMPGGWFSISRNKDNPEYIDIAAESKDKTYAVGMMELAKGIINDRM